MNGKSSTGTASHVSKLFLTQMYRKEGEKRYCRHRAAREEEKDLLHAWTLSMSSVDMAPGMGRWEEAAATPLRGSVLRGLWKKPCPGFLHPQLSEQEEWRAGTLGKHREKWVSESGIGARGGQTAGAWLWIFYVLWDLRDQLPWM